MDTTNPVTLVALSPLDDARRHVLTAEYGEPSLVVDGGDGDNRARHIEVLRALESNEPVGTLLVVVDESAPPAILSEIRRFGARYRTAVYVEP